MNDQELTSGLKDFFAEDTGSGKGASGVIGGIGVWILHLVVFAFAFYSGYHGISATARYHADNGLGMAAGIGGIVVIEVVLIGLYLAYFNRRITGDKQKVAAAATAGLGFVLSCLGIVGDSQMQAGMEVSRWLSVYLTWGLPIAPAFMALGAAVVMATEPKHLRLMSQAVKHEDFEEKRHAKIMAKKGAELQVAQDLANVQLNAREQAGRYVLAAYRSPDVQRYVQAAALANLPELMRSIGVDLPYGTVIEGQTIAPLPSMPVDEPQEEPPAAPSWLDRLPWRKSATEPTPTQPAQPPAAAPTVDPALIAAVIAALGNSTHDTARHEPVAIPLAQPAAGQGNGPAGHRIGGQHPNE